MTWNFEYVRLAGIRINGVFFNVIFWGIKPLAEFPKHVEGQIIAFYHENRWRVSMNSGYSWIRLPND